MPNPCSRGILIVERREEPMKTNQIKIFQRTLKDLEKATKIDPYKIERFRHQLNLAIIKEKTDGQGD